jgi:hypothetical protein
MAQSERRYNPKAATDPESKQVSTPGIMPVDAMDCRTLKT